MLQFAGQAKTHPWRKAVGSFAAVGFGAYIALTSLVGIIFGGLERIRIKEARRHVVAPCPGDRDLHPVQSAPFEHAHYKCSDHAQGSHLAITPSRLEVYSA